MAYDDSARRRRREEAQSGLVVNGGTGSERLDRMIRSLAGMASRCGELSASTTSLITAGRGDVFLLRQKIATCQDLLLGAHRIAVAIRQRPLARASDATDFLAGVMMALRSMEKHFDKAADRADAAALRDDPDLAIRRRMNDFVRELQAEVRNLMPGLIRGGSGGIAMPEEGPADPLNETWPTQSGGAMAIAELPESFARTALQNMAQRLASGGAETDVKRVLGTMVGMARTRQAA